MRSTEEKFKIRCSVEAFDTVYPTELPSVLPPIREDIEHVIGLNPETKPIYVPQ